MIKIYMYENTEIKRPLKVDFTFNNFCPIQNLGLLMFL